MSFFVIVEDDSVMRDFFYEYFADKDFKELNPRERAEANKLYALVNHQFHEEETTYRAEALEYFTHKGDAFFQNAEGLFGSGVLIEPTE